jgi:fibronectin-binding autotransporter adhesin
LTLFIMEIITLMSTRMPGLLIGGFQSLFLVMGILGAVSGLQAQDLYVGDTTSGNFTNISTGTNAYGSTYVGNSSTSSNNLLVVSNAGTLLTNAANLTVGWDGSSNNMVIAAGGRVVVDDIAGIGFSATATNNTVLVTGAGSLWTNGSTVFIGNDGSGTLTVANGGEFAASGQLSVGVNPGSAGTLNVGRFGTNDAAGTLNVASINLGGLGLGVLNFNQSNTVTLSAVISGSGVVNMYGLGTTKLTGDNTYTGGTLINAGTLFVGTNGTTGTLGTGNITNNANLLFVRSNDYLVGNQISGTGSIFQNGDGTLTLTAANNYTGQTWVAKGALQIGDGGSTGSLGSGNVRNSALLIFNRSNDLSVSNVISGAGSLTQAGTGTTTLSGDNIYSGGTRLLNGALSVDLISDSLTSLSRIGKSGTLSMGGGTLIYSGNTASTTARLVDISTANTNSAVVISDPNGSLTLSGNIWSSDPTHSNVVLNKLGSGTLQIAGAGANVGLSLAAKEGVTLLNALTNAIYEIRALEANATVRLLRNNQVFQGNAPNTTGNIRMTGGTFDLNGFNQSINALIGATNGANASYGTGTITSTGSSTLTVGTSLGARHSFFAGTIQGGISLVKNGSSILKLTGDNTYTGGTLINAGNLLVGTNGTTGTLGSGNITNHGKLVFDRSNDYLVGNLISGTGPIYQGGSGTLILTAANTYSGLTFISTSGALQIGNGGSTGSLGSGDVANNNGLLIFNRSDDLTVSNVISGTGSLTQAGTGTTTLISTNTYTGTTTVSAGRLVLSSAYGSTNFLIGLNSTLQFDVPVGRILDGSTTVFSGSGVLLKTGGGTLQWGTNKAIFAMSPGSLIDVQTGVFKGGSNGNEDWTSDQSSLNVAGGASFLGVEANVRVDALTGSGVITSGFNGAGYSNFTIGVANGSGTFTGSLANGSTNGNFVKAGSGTQVLSGTNTYTGTTTVSNGELVVSGLLGSGNYAGSIVNNSMLIFSNSASQTLRGVVSGIGSFVQAGAGTTTLSGVNTYVGTTAINGGTLLVNGLQNGVGAYSVNTNGALGGSGTITAAVGINDGRAIAPGNPGGIGTLTVGALTMSTGALSYFTLGTPSSNLTNPVSSVNSRLAVNGNLTLGGEFFMVDNAGANGQGSVGPGAYRLITYTGTVSGTLTNSQAIIANNTFYFPTIVTNTTAKAIDLTLTTFAQGSFFTNALDFGAHHIGVAELTTNLAISNVASSPADYLAVTLLANTSSITVAGVTNIPSNTPIAPGSNSFVTFTMTSSNAGVSTGTAVCDMLDAGPAGTSTPYSLGTNGITYTAFFYTGQSVWVANSGNWTNFSNWNVPGGTPGLDGNLSTNDTATFGTGSGGTVTLNTNAGLNALTFSNAATYTVSGTGTISLVQGSNSPSISTITGSHVIANAMVFSNTIGLSNNVGSSLGISGNISGPGGIIKSGAGTTTLSGVNTYAGTTVINAGTLLLNGSHTGGGAYSVNSGGTVGGIGSTASHVTVNSGGVIAPGTGAPAKTLTVGGLTLNTGGIFNVLLGGASTTAVASTGPVNLGGILFFSIDAPLTGSTYVFLTSTGPISGTFDGTNSIPTGYELIYGANSVFLQLITPPTPSYPNFIIPGLTKNQVQVAAALNSWVSNTPAGDKTTVLNAITNLPSSQWASAFNAIAPTLYQSLSTIAFNAANAQYNDLVQQMFGLRVSGTGFSMSGFADNTAMIQEGQGDGDKGVLDSKKDILRPGADNHWGMFVDGNGIFAQANSGNMLQSYNAQSGGLIAGLTYKWNPAVTTGIYAGYEGTYAKYNGTYSGSTVIDNAVRFGLLGTFGDPSGRGFYGDALVGGSYNNYNVTRAITFPGVSRTANSSPGAGELDSLLAAGYNWRKGNWAFGPVSSLQYTYFGMNSFNETGAQSLDYQGLNWNTASMIYNLGGNCAYSWQATQNLMVVPQINLAWQHEFLQNPYAINGSLSGASVSNTSATPLRDTLYTGVGVTLEYKKRWNLAFFYNAAAGNSDLVSQNIFLSAGVKF